MNYVDRWAIAMARNYQKHASPHKGYQCAHRVFHGDSSCSEYFCQRVAQEGLGPAIAQMPPRFRACHAASLALKALPKRSRPERDREGCLWLGEAACCVLEFLPSCDG
ncbi:MAG: membrane protein insertion efficiency factor YidD [Oscillatoriales cyanobacterium SM2_2_1]|nr:membrane protein insertion efficiency factor YidD [Oscillatoriales cyanobacterium SM2_2_1]